MKKIKIANTEFEYLFAKEGEVVYNGIARRGLTVTCAENAIGLDVLNALLVEKNLASIVATDDETGVVTYYDGYVIKIRCGIVYEKIADETAEHPAAYEHRIVFELCKRTYTEEQLAKLL